MSLFKHRTQIQKEFDYLFNKSSKLGTASVNQRASSQPTTTQNVIAPIASGSVASPSSNVNSRVIITSSNYTLDQNIDVIVFTNDAICFLPQSNGSGKTYRIVCRAGYLTIKGVDPSDKIKGSIEVELTSGEDLIITDTQRRMWE